MFITSLSLFVTVVFAWFTLSNESNMQLANIQVVDGFSFDYEIKYYSKDYIFKFDQNLQTILVYNASTSSWVTPMNLPGGPVYLIDGVFLSQYDILIPENNYKNNLIIELSVDFTNDVPIVVSHKLDANPAISNQVISSMILETNRAYYVSEVSNVQSLISNAYNAYSDTFNKYSILNTEFNLRDGSNNLIYPKHSFYQNNVYQSTIEFGSTVIQPNSTLNYYYNFSYDTQRVNNFFSQEFHSSVYDVSNIPMILFFQDIQMVIYGGNNL
jgi:hypothetical protein